MLYVKAAAKISNHGAAYLHGSEHLEMEIAMSRLPISALALLGLMTLAACDTSSGGSGGIGGMSQSQTVGTGAGAAAGGMAGYLISGGPAGALIGAAAGGLIGNRLGNYLEGDEQQAAAHLMQQRVPPRCQLASA
jgi:osmotically inducible lipoprotein OsmB